MGHGLNIGSVIFSTILFFSQVALMPVTGIYQTRFAATGSVDLKKERIYNGPDFLRRSVEEVKSITSMRRK
jgi:hypothetical protein